MKLTILGAAGVRTPLILQALNQRQEQVELSDLALMDIDRDRLDVINTLSKALLGGDEYKFRITPTTNAREALNGADYVITTFRVGGIASRIIDERVPLEKGILGQETTGPGGFAMAMRTIPVLLDYIELMREVCPQAWLVNFANPSGLLTELILRVAKWNRAVGICDAPGAMHRIASALIGALPEEVHLDYFGLNHLGWVRSVIYRGKNYVPDLLRLIEQAGGLPDIPFDPGFINELGMIPNEYLYYYYFKRKSVENILRSEQTRGEQIFQLNEGLFTDLREYHLKGNHRKMKSRYLEYLDERGATYMSSETGMTLDLAKFDPGLIQAVTNGGYAGVALELIEALRGSAPRVMTINLQNHGAIWGIDDEDVVEIPALVSKDMIRPLAVGTIPDHCLALIKQVKEYERLTIAAAVEGSYSKAVHALTIHPLIGDYTLANQIVNGYREQHGNSFPKLN